MGTRLVLECDGVKGCAAPPTHIDDKGFIYCRAHGIARKAWRRCRQLTRAELRILGTGEPIASYDRPAPRAAFTSPAADLAPSDFGGVGLVLTDAEAHADRLDESEAGR